MKIYYYLFYKQKLMDKQAKLYELISFCKKKNIFLHIGTGNYKKIEYEDINIDTLTNENMIFKSKSLDNIFSDRSEFCQIPLTSNYRSKPFACTWWSNGNWLTFLHEIEEIENIQVLIISNPINILQINTYNEFIKFCEKYSPRILSPETNKKNLLIQKIEINENDLYLYNTYRILVKNNYQHYLTNNFLKEYPEIDSITFYEFLDKIISKNVYISIEEIHEKIILQYPNIDVNKLIIIDHSNYSNLFINSNLEYTIVDLRLKYLKLISDEYVNNYSSINWDLIKENGYYGVYFGFCNLTEIGCTYEEIQKYNWYNGFDVESLIVWNTKAYDKIHGINLLF